MGAGRFPLSASVKVCVSSSMSSESRKPLLAEGLALTAAAMALACAIWAASSISISLSESERSLSRPSASSG